MSRPSPRRPRTIFLIGISGSGKGTQAAKLRRILRPSYYLEIGKRVRRYIGRRTIGGERITQTTTRGELIPTWTLLAILGLELLERIPPGIHIITDGTPRRLAEAELWDEIVQDAGRPLPVALYLALSERQARRRLLKRGRPVDDHPAAIRRRFAYFRKDVLPVVTYYRARRRLVTVNGDQPIQAVWRDIRRALKLR
ncbi:MAG: nucleoside monophosphate kinase [Candidatus Sungbacteria bacterium]|uniref:Adenylate kinase n=1 Tax=Candidatus Sungiibacteriota bacterium TaxID=2750080 RepID=A0A933DSM8_9BACT|nr:nucleoside monophosphate kinase [Candidatus Sungbacteria bacterium]